ncbi:DUF4065 domain-containing protein [Brevibacterium sp. 50QC2O2]|uniref:Panacea domain-containing protein n=1 Tax=unclassified Brevibacterium TaxID=2614124 RepID=UPI00211BAC95|nr:MULTISPECIES: type II toxin-antitoxin system antitoxin SocA domain-containing protein [unclassified Brevibacterium]MCQ9367497.1 DUF4065 domain-containing protein [Brevibacterium sp. 91QC2O2]MCQ9387819.1 DUF4065 domain-containing protein [Brevibacterium sp. 50QC2O2]
MTRATSVLAYIKARLPAVQKTKAFKLLYYAEAWNLTWTGRPLFDEPIEAWQFGPVERSSYQAFDTTPPNLDGLTPEQASIVDAVLAYYGSKSRQDLVDLSHSETPWRSAFYSRDGGHENGKTIDAGAMIREYSSQSVRGVGPTKPALPGEPADQTAVDDIARAAIQKWAGALNLLAQR